MKRITGPGPNPSGLCMCGCGNPAPIAPRSERKTGDVMGQPRRFIRHHHKRSPQPEYIIDPVAGCWVWQHVINKRGYGVEKVSGHNRIAHRVYYERYVGSIPPGLQIDHLCRNRACVNPAHMEVVTNAENSHRGLNSKLTWEKVELIRGYIAAGETHRAVARRFGVHRTCISSIHQGRTWVAR